MYPYQRWLTIKKLARIFGTNNVKWFPLTREFEVVSNEQKEYTWKIKKAEKLGLISTFLFADKSHKDRLFLVFYFRETRQ